MFDAGLGPDRNHGLGGRSATVIDRRTRRARRTATESDGPVLEAFASDPTHLGTRVIRPSDASRGMATTTTRTKTIVNCLECGAMIAAELDERGSVCLLGTEDACQCGGREFRRLR
ncbi:hypothetical protein C493_16439 [Natronolimnohabitans innermongolicus JCM 12255]|uniref:Uncharacterized protein n=2 Tax=Natronolimnohabitans innermongolicus TaxID=253107 RepID=L9WRY6_9EURY|nr:hypothetical protein C493_16439 [Natronolimnohabitans innermongolicus JCM 12255]